ncbi:Zinc finger protein AEBP2 [Halotydeus destructor]|nr:Zinc finger protein AEBP2 [Halotydeus destructor]
MCSKVSTGSSSNHNNGRNGGSQNGTPNKSSKRKKCRIKKRCLIRRCSEDFFDSSTMEQIQFSLFRLNQMTAVDTNGGQNVLFSSTVKAVLTCKDGKVKKLLHWFPEEILPDEWVSDEEEGMKKTKSVPITSLPKDVVSSLLNDTATNQPRIKQRRK